MAVWASFIDLVHLIGAVGCVLLTGGFAAQGDPARAGFYAAATLAFAVAYAHRRHVRTTAAPRSGAPAVIDLRSDTPSAVPAVRAR